MSNAGESHAKTHNHRAQYRDQRNHALDGIALPEQPSLRATADGQCRVSKSVIDHKKNLVRRCLMLSNNNCHKSGVENSNIFNSLE
jgi:hypothetical protein